MQGKKSFCEIVGGNFIKFHSKKINGGFEKQRWIFENKNLFKVLGIWRDVEIKAFGNNSMQISSFISQIFIATTTCEISEEWVGGGGG